MLAIFRLIFEFIKGFATIVILAFLMRYILVQTFLVDGTSMQPNYQNNDFVLVDKLSYKLRSPMRGETIILHPPQELNSSYIKRIIGLPGETISIEKNTIAINGEKITEPYLQSGEQTLIGGAFDAGLKRILKDDEYFVLGDNRENSLDSRSFGVVPEKNIVGRVFFIAYPFDQARAVRAPSFGQSNL